MCGETIEAIKVRFDELLSGRGRSRGQFTVIGLIMVFIALLVYAGIHPVIVNTISDAGFTGADKIIADLIPFMFLVGILLSVLVYATPQRQQY